MHETRPLALLGIASILLAACAADPAGAGTAQGSSDLGRNKRGVEGTDPSAAPSPSTDVTAPASSSAATPAPTLYTLTLTSPAPNASASGTIAIAGLAPGFVNVEVHSPTHALLARVTPDAAGNFSASIDTTSLANGAQTLVVDAWDSPAGSEYTHHADAALALDVSNAAASCIDANGNGIRHFGAYTKNTQTNYDFDAWSGFHQDFLTSFMSCDTWSHAASSDWGFDIMQLQPPGENIQEIVCLTTSEDPSLQHVASGMYDASIQQMADLFIKHGYPNAFIRVGHEFDGTWYPWSLSGVNDGDYAGFIAAFRHVAAILKATSPTFTIVWNPGCSYWAEAMKDELAYPGDDVVDVIGVDCYDDGTGVDHLMNGAYGMNQWAQFAKAHNKPIALPEWGLMHGDNPAYVQAMFDFMTKNDTFLESFWDSDDGNTQSQLSTGEAPNSGATFLQTFGQFAHACRP